MRKRSERYLLDVSTISLLLSMYSFALDKLHNCDVMIREDVSLQASVLLSSLVYILKFLLDYHG